VTLLRRLAAMLSWIRRRERAEAGLDAELRSYVELAAADKARDGLSPDEARRQAILELGGIEPVKEQVRRGRHGGGLDEIGRDVRHALRFLARTPGFTAAVVVTLALGIGANTAIFSVVDALLLRWLPVRAPQELAQISLVARGTPADVPGGTLSYPIVQLLARQRDLFSGIGAFSGTRLNLGPPDAVASRPAAIVAGDFFGTLGLEAAAGRLLTAADDTPEAPAAVVISDGYWERRFGRSPDVLGRTILIDGVAVPIVGVTPRGFSGATVGVSPDVTITAAAQAQITPRTAALLGPGTFWLRVLARPAAGVSWDRAASRLAAMWGREAGGVLSPRWPASQRAELAAQVVRLSPGGTGWTHLRVIYRTPLLVLMAMVGVVLLIACANVACLLLARASARRHETALRLALGAGRGRVVRQLVTEGLLLALAGGALGIGLAWAASAALVRLMATPLLPTDVDVAPSARVLAFTAATSIASALLFAVLPALHATSVAGRAALTTGARASRRRSRWLSLLVSTRVSLALVLLAGAGLFVRTFGNLQRLDAGFTTEGVVIAELDGRRLGDRDLAADVARLPGVTAATLATHTPLNGWQWSEAFVPAGQPLPQRDTAAAIGVGPAYFDTLRIAIRQGRGVEAGDTATAPAVAVVNEAFAERFFGDRPVVGRRLVTGMGGAPNALVAGPAGAPRQLTIVGLAGDTRTNGLRAPAPPTVYVPLAQVGGRGSVTLVARGQGSIASLSRTIEPVVRAAVPGTPVEVRPLAAQVEATIVQERVLALLATVFGVLALLLTAVGLYGVVAFGVVQRLPELGVRLALGARGSQVLRLVLADGARLVLAGVVVGLPYAWLASHLVRALLFGVAPVDPVSAAIAVGTLVAAALGAAYLPARRAARTDPLLVLRRE
jgi:predicted permease